jgi:hypothetical protein
VGTARRLPCPHHANTPRVQVGKTTLIKALIKHWVRQDVRDVRGPVTLVTGKSRRLTLLECPQELGPMMDAAKVSACACACAREEGRGVAGRGGGAVLPGPRAWFGGRV